MIKKILSFIAILIICGCARVQTLNLEKHNYSERPRHIVWFQIAGFSEEHIPLLKFNIPETSYHTSFEKADCLGKIWSFNLYDLRPSAAKSFLSQVNGSKNIKSECADYAPPPVWELLQEIGYSVSLYENGASEDQSLENSLECPKNKTLDVSRLRFYRSGPDVKPATLVKKKFFHYQDSIAGIQENLNPGLYYDKSCQKNLCYSSLSNNFKTLWGQFTKDQYQSFFLLREFNFLKALKKKDIGYAKEILQEIEKIVSWVKLQKDSNILILITGAESLNIEYPNEGNEWAEFEKSGKNVIYKNSSLMSPVFAFGSMSENFCGLFDESEMQKRVMYRPENKIFNWDALNPF